MKTTTIAAHLVQRLRELGTDEGFGIVGDFALRLFGRFDDLGFPIRITADEQGAAFAADAYARIRRIGLVAVTYGVGGLKVANATAGAWAEQVPLLVVSGAPGMSERQNDPMLHHKVKTFETQIDVFRDLTVAQAVLSEPLTASREIDRVIGAMMREQRPGYIEVPRDMVDVTIIASDGPLELPSPFVNEEALAEAVRLVMARLDGSSNSVLLAGVMAWRRGLRLDLLELAEILELPVATTSLAKGLFPERHPLSLGVYMGAVSPHSAVKAVEGADPLLAFGALYTDLTMGGFTAHFDLARVINCTDTRVHVGLTVFEDVPLSAFLPALLSAGRSRQTSASRDYSFRGCDFLPQAIPLTVESVFSCLEAKLDERHGVIVEPGDSLFASVDFAGPGWCLTSGYYATMGYSVPAAIGMGKADPTRRPVIVTGDGAFLMMGFELAAAHFHGVNPVVVILDNDGYGTQRLLLDGPFNDIPTLNTERLPDVIGAGKGYLCTSQTEFWQALQAAVADEDFAIIRAKVPKNQSSAALRRLTEALAKKV